MRHFFIILLLNVPLMTRATISAPPRNCENSEIQFSFSKKESGGKRGFFKQFAEKTLLKRLKKAAARSGDGDGKWLAISGFSIGLLGILAWAFISYTGVFLPLALGLTGLILSILGLIKASQWEDAKVIRGLAIAGIVLNSLACVLGVFLSAA